MTSTTRPGNQRQLFREALNATAILRVRDREILCKTCDISENGLGLILRDGSVQANESIEANVLIGNIMKTFRGVVLYTQPLAHGPLRVGMRFATRCEFSDAAALRPLEPVGEERRGEGFSVHAAAQPVTAARHRPAQVQPTSGSKSAEDIVDVISLHALVEILMRKGLVSEEEIWCEVEAGRGSTLAKTHARDAKH